MNITIKPELEKLIQSELETGEYNNIDDLLRDALVSFFETKKRKGLSQKVNDLFDETQALPHLDNNPEPTIINENGLLLVDAVCNVDLD